MEAETPLEIRLYGERLGDYQLISGWWESRHGQPMPETVLPPLGVVIEQAGEAIGALWCYECIGIGVCFLEYPVTRPGLDLASAGAVMQMAVDACISIAKGHGDYSLFRAFPSDGAMSLIMGRMGFLRAEQTLRVHMAIRAD